MKLTYIGQRLNGEKLIYAYETELSTSPMLFVKPLLRIRKIGMVLEAEPTSTGVKDTKVIGDSNSKKITQWSVEERNDRERYGMVKALKVTPEGHLDDLIKKVKATTKSYVERKRIAMYIFSELLS